MIPRYTPPELLALWSSERRYQIWLEVELAACDAMESEGLVPKGTAEKIRAQKIVLNPDRIEEIERTVKHDVIAFLTHVEELAGEPARWLHLGMTVARDDLSAHGLGRETERAERRLLDRR